MRIDIHARGNCPFNPDILWSRGLGGAENAIVFLAEALAVKGHDVTVWNDTPTPTKYGHVEYKPVNDCEMGMETDLFVIFRVSIPFRPPKAKKVVFFSCDQATDIEWARMWPWLEKFICISKYHAGYIIQHWPVSPSIVKVCELGVNIEDYSEKVLKKDPARMIFCSVPHRGLNILLKLWPKIKIEIPSASLAITCDYTLWGRSSDPGNQSFKQQTAGQHDIEFYGAVPRERLVKLQKEASIAPYPCVYDENFCLSMAECIAAGAVPVTTPIGALPTTVNGSGIILDDLISMPTMEDKFVEEVVSLVSDNKRRVSLARAGRVRAKKDYSYSSVADRFLEVSLG